MKCTACGHDNRTGAKFCEECGGGLSLVCSKCGEALRDQAKFCDSCGTQVAAASGTDAAQSDHAEVLRQSTPNRIAEAIRRDHSEMEGERRIVTVLFADAVGHTSIAESLDEEEVYGLMQGCFERMQEAVHLYDGTVNQFTGDGVLALFGAPIAHEDSARRAVAAALEMQRSLSEYADDVKKRHPIQCSYRVGINTGPVVVGRISDDLDLDFAAVGDTVNLAARMESLAESGTVYMTKHTYRAVRDYFDCESLGDLTVKGKSKPVPAFRALREKPVRQRLEAATERGLTDYVGRTEELSLLTGYLNRIRGQQGQIVYIAGDAGMGKSRLLLEFRRSIADESLHWLEGHCVTYGRMTSYLPFIDIVKRSIGVEEGDNDEQIIAKFDEGAAASSEQHRAAIPYLKFLLGVDPGDDSVATMDPIERRPGTLDALRTLLQEESQRGQLVVVVEDLHWIDPNSIDALSMLVDAVAHIPVLLIVTSRPGHPYPLGDRSYISRLALGNLRADESKSMVHSVLESKALPAALLNMIGGKAEGNPFFIEEVTKSLVESGALSRRNGGYELEKSIDQIFIPDTIHEVILARIDRLDRDAKGAMQLASVIGREFTVRLLERISDVESQLDDLLSDLKSLELIYETGHSSELSYMFKHALTHDVAYSTLLVERRKTLHRIVAKAIEELYADRLSEHFEALAHHYGEGKSWVRAAGYAEKAGDKAVDAFANETAVSFFKRAFEVYHKIGDRRSLRNAIRVIEKRAWVHFVISQHHEAVSSARAALAIARELGDTKAEARCLALIGFFQIHGHDFDKAEISIREALALAKTHDLTNIITTGHIELYGLFKLLGRHDEAVVEQDTIAALPDDSAETFALGFHWYISSLDECWKGHYDRGREIAGMWRTHDQKIPQIMAYLLRWSEAIIDIGAGHYERAMAELKDLRELCNRIGELSLRARVLNTLGWVHGDLQDHSHSIELNQRCIEVALLEDDEPEKICNAKLNWADALISLGRYDEAETILLEVDTVIRNPRAEDRWMLWRFSQHHFQSYGEVAFHTGRHDFARELVGQSLKLAEPSDSTKYLIKAHRLLGDIALKEGDLSAASLSFDGALAHAQTLGNPIQLWRSYAACGNLLKLKNESAAARDAYRQARDVAVGVASGLADESLRNTLMASEEIKSLEAGT